ncbi:MAG: aldehyde dehydrogenase family protein [Candidatus Hydrogenedens sp.]|nr:aldehyde dehydrogenase family protein [Candidatus Hydrogenedens sp.]
MIQCISPVDGSLYCERPEAADHEITQALERADAAARSWASASIDERARLCGALVDAFVAQGDTHRDELAWQMGRPVRYGLGEVRGFEERARKMIALAPEALADLGMPEKPGFQRFIRRTPIGVLLTVAPWNYPYLTSVNSVIPALMAGNAVLLKHSHQTPLCAERFVEAGRAAGLPEGLFQFLHLSRAQTAKLIKEPAIGGVAFTGSVPGGAQIEEAAAGRFIPVGLELGGKDPAYVRHDANLAHAIENVVDGAFFNSGQSCCGVERIYVHADVYDAFVEGAVELTKQYVLGSPLDEATTLGPCVRTSAADFVRGQVAEAVAAGAKALVDPAGFAENREGTPYLAPQLLVDVDHSMRVMNEETFGPVAGIMKVQSDEEAVALMNDSDLGLTASIWSEDVDAALALGDRIATGTVFLNRCDYLDPDLAWTGVKNTGRGCTLSRLGFEQLTRPKSFHFRVSTK